MSIKSGTFDFTIGIIKIFQRRKPLIVQHDVDTDISLLVPSSLLINQQTVLLYQLICIKVRCFSWKPTCL